MENSTQETLEAILKELRGIKSNLLGIAVAIMSLFGLGLMFIYYR